MARHTASDDLRSALAGLAERRAMLTNAELILLRGYVFDAVDEMRASRMHPERIVEKVKRLAVDSRVARVDSAVFDRLIDWCFQQCYGRSLTM